MTSIIIAYHNEGKEFILETLDSIYSTIDIDDYEIIIVDDCSDVPLELEKVKVIRHSENLGVGRAFDTGVAQAQGDNLFIMGCDVRFADNRWASKMNKEIEAYPKSFTCTSVVSLYLDKPEITFEYSRKLYVYNGATILFLHGHSDNPDMPDKFHSILNAQWLPREYIKLMPPDVLSQGDPFKEFLKEQCNIEYSRSQSYEIPCILGAFYGVKKEWYKYVDGFWGHRQWGTLEPYISLKSWLFGGSCRTCHIETGHLFKSDGTHNTDFVNIAYNKLMVAALLFNYEDNCRLIDWLPKHDYITKAMEKIIENRDILEQKQHEYREKTVFPVSELVKKFNLKF